MDTQKANLVLVITSQELVTPSQAFGTIIARLVILNRLPKMSTHASGLNFCAFLRAEADAADDKARRLRIQAATLTQTAGLDIGKFPICGVGLSLGCETRSCVANNQLKSNRRWSRYLTHYPPPSSSPLATFSKNIQPTSLLLLMNTASPSTPARSEAASPNRRRGRGSPAHRSASTRATRCT